MKIAIVGNGIAGITAAKYISEKEPRASITVFTDEEYNYYPRPLLDRLLSESITLDGMFPYNDEWYKKRGIRVSLGDNVTAVDTTSKKIKAAVSGTSDYDKLLLTTGASPFVPPIEGVSGKEVFTYRNISDVLRIRSLARDKKKAAVIGGGLLGLETAKALTERGMKVVVVEHNSRLLPRQLDEEGAALIKYCVEKTGIEVLLSQSTCCGIDADLFIAAAGVRPNTSLAKSCGIGVQKGIIVDGNLRTNCPDVFAAGDCAEFNGTVYGIIPAALEQGLAAASNMTGVPAEYKGTTFQATLKVVGIDVTTIGAVNPEGEGYESLSKKDEAKGTYRRCIIKDGKLVGAIVIGEKAGVSSLANIIKEGADVSKDKDALMGDDAALSGLLRKGANR
ncbi:MAG TPA: FAD-dependent oxidoreductase [Candidatus Omnitrophota bacterium]|nr:FAD-dependent oxidoreductase [Candidatus Omnitrophota bacterium]